MYLFQIVKPRFARKIRFVFGSISVLGFMLITPLIMMFVVLPAGILNNEFVFPFITIIFLMVVLLFYLFKEVVEKTIQIGTLEVANDKFIITTGKIYKEIHFVNVSVIKFQGGTGHGTWTQTTTILVAIVTYDRHVTNLHVTREWFNGALKQKKRIWNRNMDLFDLFEKNKLSSEVSRSLRESTCLSE